MSTFDGVLEEYPLISIDRFLEPENYSSTVYFLSHCHKDHMNGLNHHEFYKLLKRRGYSKIYLSDVSGHLLRHDEVYEHLANYLVELRIEEPTIIDIFDEEGNAHSKVTVTLLTAGHCPGSVMFYFEGDNGNVLYTGDFRLPVGSADRLVHLHDSKNCPKPLKSIYIDTTFCNEKCLYIPSREECLNEIVSIVEPWLSKGPNYIVYILCPYELAYEFVFVELYKRFGLKTHVNDELGRKYTGIKLLESAITISASEARIHACIKDKDGKNVNNIQMIYPDSSPCGFVPPNAKPVHVMKIKPSAMFFTNKNFAKISDYNYKTNLHRVYYSTHPSLSEIQDMVFHLKPNRVFPNVVHDQTVDEILELIFHPHEIASVGDQGEIPDSLSISPLGKLKCPSPKAASSQETDSLPFFDDCYDVATDKKTGKRSSTKFQSYNLKIDTDFDNTEEQETMLREEIYSQKVENKNCSEINKSSLKWENPVVSSDEEIFESSSDSSSVEDNEDSDTFGEASQETCVKSSLEEKETDKGMTECTQSNESAREKSHQTDSKPFLMENGEVNDRTICKTQLSNPEVGSAKSTESESLINEQYVNYLWDYNNCNRNNVVLHSEISFHIDKEYLKISEVDNGIDAVIPEKKKIDNLNFNKPLSAQRKQYDNEKMLDISANMEYISASSSKQKNYNSVSSSKVVSSFLFSENMKTHDELKICVRQNAENTGMLSPPHYLIRSDSSSDQYNSTAEVAGTKNSDLTINHCVNLDQQSCEEKLVSKNQCIIDFKETSVKTNGHQSKSFQFVKKINSESESEDEYDFKYVIKKFPKNCSNHSKISKNCSIKRNCASYSDSVVNDKQDFQYINKFCHLEKQSEIVNATVATTNCKNELTETFPIVHASIKTFDSKQVKPSNATQCKNVGVKFNLETENQSNIIHDSVSYNSLKHQSCSYNHDTLVSKNIPFHKSFNIASDAKPIYNNNFDEKIIETSNVVEKIFNPLKVHKSNSLTDNECKNLNQESVDLSSDYSSGEMFTLSPEKELECKMLSNVKNFRSQKVPLIENEHKSQLQNASASSRLICPSNKENTSDVDNFHTHKSTVKCNFNDDIGLSLRNLNVLHSTNVKSEENSPEILSENHAKDKSSSMSENNVLEKINRTWEIKTLSQSSSNSSVIVEEIHSSSDSDDSPSLIAPNVPKTSDSANCFTGSFCDLKRRRIEWEKNISFNNNEDFIKGDSKICDNFVVDSDSTPELLEYNLLPKNESSFKKPIPEIFIDDDNNEW